MLRKNLLTVLWVLCSMAFVLFVVSACTPTYVYVPYSDQNGTPYQQTNNSQNQTPQSNSQNQISSYSQPPANIAVSSLSLNKSELVLNSTYETAQENLIASIYPSNATNKKLIWESSDTSVAKVNENGTVTAGRMGKAIITAKSDNGKSATCTVYTYSENDFHYKINNGEAHIYGTKYGNTSTEIYIPEYINSYPVTRIARFCNGIVYETIYGELTETEYLPNNNVRELILPKTVNYINIDNCSSLTKINIPDGVTSVSLTSCTSITNIIIPNSVAGLNLSGCTNLTNVNIPNRLRSIGDSAFYNCMNLKNITIPNSVTLIGREAFYGCDSLTSVTIPDSVTSIGNGAFVFCINLSSVTIGNGVTSIGDSAFAWCCRLKSVTIPENVTNIGQNAFNGSGLTSVTFKNTSSWYVLKSAQAVSGTNVSVTDSTQNATYLKFTYCDYFWKRK